MQTAERPFYIYMHTAPNGKRYVGQTCLEPEKRWSNGNGYVDCTYMHRAIEKYGWDNFKHDILCVVHSKKMADLFEQYYISKFDTFNEEKGYNLTEGGGGVLGCVWSEERKREHSKSIRGEGNGMYGRHHTEESRRKMSEKLKGRQSSPEMREFRTNILLEANKKRQKAVRQLDLDGNLIATYRSLSEAEEVTGHNHGSIVYACQGLRDNAYGYRWEYEDEGERAKAEEVRRSRPKSGVAIIQLDTDGNVVSHYSSMHEAERIGGFNRNKISDCCRGKRDAYAGYRWLLADQNTKEREGVAVIQLSLDGELVAKYENITDACKRTGFSRNRITRCCRGLQATSSGYIWKYAEGGTKEPRPNGQKVPIVQLDMSGNEVSRFKSLTELERLGFNRHTISDCCKGLRDSYRDFRWQYANAA